MSSEEAAEWEYAHELPPAKTTSHLFWNYWNGRLGVPVVLYFWEGASDNLPSQSRCLAGEVGVCGRLVRREQRAANETRG